MSEETERAMAEARVAVLSQMATPMDADAERYLDALEAAIRADERAKVRAVVSEAGGRDHDGCGQLYGDTTNHDAYLHRDSVLAILDRLALLPPETP